MRRASLWLAVWLALGLVTPALSTRTMLDDTGSLESYLRNSNYQWVTVAVDRLGSPPDSNPPFTYLLPGTMNMTASRAEVAANYVRSLPKETLRGILHRFVLKGAYATPATLLAAGNITTRAKTHVTFVESAGGQLLAQLGGRVYPVHGPVHVVEGKSAVYLLGEPRSEPVVRNTSRPLPAPVSSGRVLLQTVTSGAADTQFCFKVRFGIKDGVRILVSEVDNYDWADDRRPDLAFGDRIVLPGGFCALLNTNGNSNPKWTISVGKMPEARDNPAMAQWESYRMEMDTWWLRTFAVSVWQGFTAFLGDKVEVVFPTIPPPWPMVDKSSFEAFGGHVSIKWESGLFDI